MKPSINERIRTPVTTRLGSNYWTGITLEPLTFEDTRRTREANAEVVQDAWRAFLGAVP
ncbi:MAG: hypothetical protein ACE5EW_01505 [Thermoplasmata archaeon]